MSLLVHPQTHRQVASAQAAKVHALILHGKEGAGLKSLAEEMARSTGEALYVVQPEKDEKIDLEKGSLTIQSIRRLYDVTKTKLPSGRLIVIDYADRMGIPAQNAFLKLLEEPVEGNRFVLLIHSLSNLLPTIISRSQTIDVKPISRQQSEQLLDELKVTDATKRTQLLFIANGLPAALTRLASDDALFTERAQTVKDARTFTTGSAYDRLSLAQKYKNNRVGALTMIEDAGKMIQSSLARTGNQSYVQALTNLELLHKRLTEQGNIRLQLSAAITLLT